MNKMLASQWVRIVVIGACVAPSAVVALPVEVSASTTQAVSARDCVAGVTPCDDVSGGVVVVAGLPGDVVSSASVSPPGYGQADGRVALSGEIGAPVFSASARSEPGKRLNTTAAALQRYVYEGSVSTTRTFGGTVTYSQFATGEYPVGVSGLNVALEVFTLANSTIAIEPTEWANFGMLLGDYAAEAGYTSLGSDQYIDSSSTMNGVGQVAVAVTLNPGDAVWVWALLQTPAANGGWVDASHTFVTAWDDPTDLVPAAVVPEPGTWALFLAGGVALAARRRRRHG